jgi:hypothetical protein
MILRLLAITAFIAAACTLWLPFDSHFVLYATKPGGAMPAGEIREGFELSQRVNPEQAVVFDGPSEQPHCFGIRFATYQRENTGHLEVRWQQEERFHTWRVDVARLADNTYRHYCPSPAFLVERPFKLRIRGVDGKLGHSATLWLVNDRRFGTAKLDGNDPADEALALQVTEHNRVRSTSILLIDNGAFLFGWLCTLVVGTISLLWAFGQNGKRKESKQI